MLRAIKFNLCRKRGAALLITVLVVFLVLSILALIGFNISVQMSHVEQWQTDHYEKLRLSYLARSSANAVIEAISDDLISLGASASSPINKHATTSFTDTGDSLSIDIVISGDASPYLLIKTKAYNDKEQSVFVTAKYDTSAKLVTQWWRGGP